MVNAPVPEQNHTYARYLQLGKLLSSQVTMTGSDDELLFIIMHQSHELWFKLSIHELTCAIDSLMRRDEGDHCLMAYKRLCRVSEIQHLLIQSWDVLATLTPDEFHVFRDTVGRNGASGFQSVQYRIFEFKMGLKYSHMTIAKPTGNEKIPVAAYAETGEDRLAITEALKQPGIYDATIDYMARLPGSRIRARSDNDYSSRHRRSHAVFDMWQYVYRNRDKAPELYQLGEKLVDLEDAFRRWRFVHLATVSRVIGINRGTGGSSGLPYLQAIANQLITHPLYPELWEVRNAMFRCDRQ